MSTVDMPPPSSSWPHFSCFLHPLPSTTVGRSLTHSTAAAVGKTDDQKQTWRAWAAQKIRSRMRSPRGNSNNEILNLFPGWAARRYPAGQDIYGQPAPFEVEAFVSGYATRHRSREQATRSQRAFIRLAKGFASLPRITDHSASSDSPSTDELLNQVNTPKVTDDFRIKVLEGQLQSLKSDDSGSESESESSSTPFPDPTSPLPAPTLPPKHLDTKTDVLQKLHYNLESRLQAFWSSTLPARTVRIHLFASPRNFSPGFIADSSNDFEHGPLASQDVTTGTDGSFSARFHINWQVLCQHPKGRRIAICETLEEHDLVVVAELLPSPSPSNSLDGKCTSESSSPSSSQCTLSNPPAPSSHPQLWHSSNSDSHSSSHRHTHLHSVLANLPTLHNLPALASTSPLSRFFTPKSTAITRAIIPLTHTPIRVISDIDDTIKRSGVTEGARAVFHNVFVKELKDGIIPGMGDWYTDMWNRGLRFHYVSNGPFEYLSLLHEFFHLSKLPPGSIKLKSYAGKSLLSGLLSTPAARKRAGVIDILESFPDSKFLLIGDSGEQDLELYVELARERPTQILAIFIRDTDEMSDTPLDDPTGWGALSFGAQNQFADGFTDNLASIGDGGDQATPRPGRVRRMFSDTFAYTRSGKFTSGPLREDPLQDNSAETPTQRQFPTFHDSSLRPMPLVSSYPSSVSSLPSGSSSLPSAPPTLVQTPTFITKQPPPVPSLIIPSSSTSTTSSSHDPTRSTTDPLSTPLHNFHRQEQGFTKSRSKLIKSQTSPAEYLSSPYYKPLDSPSRSSYLPEWGSSGRRNSGGPILGGVGSSHPREGRSSRSSGSSGSWSGSSAKGWSGGGKASENKKRQDLQMRVYTARTQMPSSVKLRVFMDPSECFEDVDELLLVSP